MPVNLPSHRDLRLLDKIKSQGNVLIEDLQKILSYRKPKTYKIFLDKLSDKPDENEIIINELIGIVQKFNKVLAEKMDEYQDKNEENKIFRLYYKEYNKLFNKKYSSKINNSEIFSELLYEYKNKNLNFQKQFLNKNIFNPCGLLPTTKKQTIDYFDSIIKSDEPNDEKGMKYIHFIEKLYKQASKLSKNFVFCNDWSPDLKNNNNTNKKEELLKKNKKKIWKKEIKCDKKEIRKLKKLIEIFNEEYNKLNLNKKLKFDINKKIKNKTLNPVKISENISPNNIKYNENNIFKNYNNDEKMIMMSKSTTSLKSDIRNLNNKNNDYFNNTSQLIINKDFKKSKSLLNSSLINNNTISTNTLSTKFTRNTLTNTIFSYKYNNNPSPNKLQEKIKILEPIKNTKNLRKSVSFSQNYNNKFTNESFTKTISDKMLNPSLKLIKQNLNSSEYSSIFNNSNNIKLEDNIKLDDNIKLEDNTNIIKNNLNNSSLKQTDKKSTKKIVLKKILKKQKSHKKANSNTNYLRRRKIPLIYEELKNCKNLLSITKSNSFLVQQERNKANKLFSQLYDKKKIKIFDYKKAPAELFNYYFNLKENIERSHDSEKIYKKYNKMLNNDIEKKIKISNVQDKELKTKYFEYIQKIIKKKIDDEEGNGV